MSDFVIDENPLLVLPRDASWDPVPPPLRMGAELAAKRFMPLVRGGMPSALVQYMLAVIGAQLAFREPATIESVVETATVYIGLFDAGMACDPRKLMELHVRAGADLEGGQETVFAARSAYNAERQSTSGFASKAHAALALYADLVEAWKLFAAPAAFGKELLTGTQFKIDAAKYLSQDGARKKILSFPGIIPAVAPFPINRLVQGLDINIRNAKDHKGGVSIEGRSPPVVVLRNRQWKAKFTLEDLYNAVASLSETILGLQTGYTISRANFREEYVAALRKFGPTDERRLAHSFELMASECGFDVADLEITDDCLDAALALRPGTLSHDEIPVTRYTQYGDGTVAKHEFLEPAFEWNTTRHLGGLLNLASTMIEGRGVILRVRGRSGEDMGFLEFGRSDTSRLGPDFGIADLLTTATGTIVDEHPIQTVDSAPT